MKLYLSNGYFNIEEIVNAGYPFSFIVGGRGTGKTYGALKYAVENNIKFMLMRRTQSQVDMINNPDFSPFKALNQEEGYNITVAKASKYNGAFFHGVTEDGVTKPSGEPIGYTCALSTISNMRGFGAEDIKLLIYDEFIPEVHERPIKNEAHAILNAYETINRNRELKGKPPLQMIALSNANDLGNAIFIELGLVRIAENMRQKGREIYTNRERRLLLCILQSSPISREKRRTALYQLTGEGDFSGMAIGNEFSGEERGRIAARPLAEYAPIVGVGELTIYRHKHTQEVYVSTHRRGSPPVFGTGYYELARFARAHGWLWDEYLRGGVVFEEYLCEILLTKYFT